MSHGTIGCIGCGGLVPNILGPTHRYMESSPGFWQVHGTVSCWRESTATLRSSRFTASRLCVALDQGRDFGDATWILGAVVQQKDRFRWLTPRRSLGEVCSS